LGFAIQLAFGAAVFAGQAIAMTMGLGFAMAVDPQNGVQVPVLSQLYIILATLLFLALDGHLLLIAAVVESYQLMPVGVTGIPATSLSAVVALGTIVFAGGILLALPALTALLLINIVLLASPLLFLRGCSSCSWSCLVSFLRLPSSLAHR